MKQHPIAPWLIMGGMFAVCAGQACAHEDWQENTLSVRWGPKFAEPGVDADIAKTIYNYTHFGHDRLGTNLFAVDALVSNSKDEATGGGDPAQEIYAFYQRSFSLSALTGQDMTLGGWARDVSIYGRFDTNTKNVDFGPRIRKYRLGLSLALPVPAGFWEVSVGAYKEQNHNGIVIPNVKPQGVRVTSDLVPEVLSSWTIPAGGIGTFEGYADYVSAKGDNGFGQATHGEIHAQMFFMFNLDGPKGSWQAGLGGELWRHKYGESGEGSRQTTGLVTLRYSL